MNTVLTLMHVFDLGPVKLAGAAALIFLLGFAAGNSHRTEAALTGQAVYFQKAEAKHVDKVAAKVATGVRAEDAKAVGVPVVVLKATVDASKAKTTD